MKNAKPAEAKPAEGQRPPPAILFDTNLGTLAERAKALAAYALRLRQEGLTLEQIAARWTAEGIPTLRWQARRWTWKNISNLVTRHGKAGG